MRAVSTALDATLCLLLVSAAALTLVHADAPDRAAPDPAESVATTLTTATAQVNYTLSTADGRRYRRSAHDTVAGLAAACAAGDVAVADAERARRTGGFERALDRKLRRFDVASDRTRRVQVVARWEPYPDASVAGRCVLGPSPPPDADVHAASVTLPSGMAPAENAGRPEGWRTYGGVADAVARSVVRGLFPPGRLGVALRNRRTTPLALPRLRRLAALTDADVDGELAAGDAAGVRRELVDALAATVESELRARYASPDRAAASTAVARVEVVVRVWSA
ncbi:DUF7284 family protein [Halomicrococcus sp. SG-WS-1]|uniref:DUF7284 family protein n=1 Tax=Halomicrococcus sp. SG-WS-1 TaxID=3439057 RepID=UPI003F7B0F53